MTTKESSAELAVLWIEAWVKMDMEWLRQRLAPDFVHVSPFGRLEGRESYLATVGPMARKRVMTLKVIDVIGSGNQAAVWFENTTPQGVVQTCDWVRIEDDMIKEIRSFYDSALVREVLSPAEQRRLDASSWRLVMRTRKPSVTVEALRPVAHSGIQVTGLRVTTGTERWTSHTSLAARERTIGPARA